MASSSRVVLLGPQRVDPDLAEVLESLDCGSGPVAVVTAGWEEREGETLELAHHLGAELRPLDLWPRGEEVMEQDGELREGLRERNRKLRELQALYRTRLSHALEAARSLLSMEGEAVLIEPERASAIAAVHALDEHHRQRTRRIVTEFREQWVPRERPSVARHRAELEQKLEGCSCLCIAGGNVGFLLHRLRLFGVLELWGKGRPVIGWGAGSMVLTDEVVLFHDSPPQGAGDAEVFEDSLGVAPGIVALPHADRRLALDDRTRVALFARRFQPAHAVELVRGSRLDWDGSEWTGKPGTRLLASSGELEEFGTRTLMAEATA